MFINLYNANHGDMGELIASILFLMLAYVLWYSFESHLSGDFKTNQQHMLK